MFARNLFGADSGPVLPVNSRAPASAIEAIKSAVAAGQEPSASSYVLYYRECAAGLHNDLANKRIDAETNEREQDAAVVCLMGLDTPE